MQPTYHYGRATRRCSYQILDIFNEFKIMRYDPSGNVTQTRTVPVRFGPKEKLYEEILKDTSGSVTDSPLHPQLGLPAMGLSFDGLGPGTMKRPAFKGINPIYFLSGVSPSGVWTKTYMPVATDFDYTLIMAGKYIDDVFQMYEQVYVIFNPILYIDMPYDPFGVGEFQKWKIDPQVYSGPKEGGGPYSQTHNPYYSAEITMKVRGYLYRYQETQSDQIHKVIASMYPDTKNIIDVSSAYEYEKLEVSATSADITTYGQSALPQSGADIDYYMRLQSLTVSG